MSTAELNMYFQAGIDAIEYYKLGEFHKYLEILCMLKKMPELDLFAEAAVNLTLGTASIGPNRVARLDHIHRNWVRFQQTRGRVAVTGDHVLVEHYEKQLLEAVDYEKGRVHQPEPEPESPADGEGGGAPRDRTTTSAATTTSVDDQHHHHHHNDGTVPPTPNEHHPSLEQLLEQREKLQHWDKELQVREVELNRREAELHRREAKLERREEALHRREARHRADAGQQGGEKILVEV